MIIDFYHEQCLRFDQQVEELMRDPMHYFQFEQIADVYAAEWLNQFPKGTHCQVSGLDDGAEEYCIYVSFREQSLMIDYAQHIKLVHHDRCGHEHRLG